MPVLPVISSVKSPPTNALGLAQYLAQRVPGYDVSEYLRELNSAYVHVWEEVTKLKNHYFTNIAQVTVAQAQYHYDLMFNGDGGLTGPLSSRLYQVTRIRVLPPQGGLFQATTPLAPNDPEFLGVNANPSSTPTGTGPYYWFMSGRNQLNMGLPLQAGTIIEVTYTFWPISLVILNNGTVASSGNTVTGTGTNFTNMVQPDFQSYLPSAAVPQEQIQAELICNPTSALGGQIYRVASITSDTSLTTATAVNPVLGSGSAYALATLPEIPREHIRVIAAIGLAKMYSVAGDDARTAEWTATAANNIQMMKDALVERQSQMPPTKGRFRYGVGRKNRLFLN